MIDHADIKQTILKTKHEDPDFSVIHMRLGDASATNQCLMSSINYEAIDDFQVVYQDDLLMYSSPEEKYFKHLRLALQKLKNSQSFAIRNKYELIEHETEFTGPKVS